MIRLIVVLLALLQGTSPPDVAVDAPAIVHVPVDRLRPGEDLVVEANVTGPRPIVRVSVSYQVGERLDHVQPRRPLRLSVDWRHHRREDQTDRGRTDR